MKWPKVLIFTPIFDKKEYCRKEFLANVEQFNYPNADFLLVDNSKGSSYVAKLRRDGVKVTHVPRGRNSRDALANAQNYARKRCLEGGYDYMLSLESDIFPVKDVIQRLMRHWKPVAGSLYYIGGIDKPDGTKQPRIPCVFKTTMDPNKGMGGTKIITPQEHQEMLKRGGLHRVHGMGVGCTLIDRNVLEKYKFWTDDRFDNKHSDVYFYMTLWNDNVEVCVDYNTVSEHLNSDWGQIEDR